jgi:ERCC4-type nuclease
MTILASPSEPSELREALGTLNNPLCEDKGADYLAPTAKGLLGIQRKQIPSDFLASLEDGRLARELPHLAREVDLPILLLEGAFDYNSDGWLQNNGRATRYKQTGIIRLLRSVYYSLGIYVEYSGSMVETPNVVRELIDYFNHEHISLDRRPKLRGLWGKPTPDEQLCYFYQGISGIGLVLARSLVQVYPQPVALLEASLNELKAIPQVGQHRADQIYKFLHEGKIK